MFEQIIMFLIYVCVVAAVIYLALYVLGTVIGVPFPPKVVQIIWVIFMLICLLLLVRIVLSAGGIHALLFGK